MNSQRRIPFGALVAVLLALCLAAGAALWSIGIPPAGTATGGAPLAGAPIGGPFELVDQDGRTVTDKDFAGRYRLIYFGYTYCPDVCPVDVQKMAQGLRAFEAKDAARAAKVQPIFVTVDPARDTPAVVKEFVAAFHPRLVGLTGSEAQVDGAMKAYRIYAQKQGAEGAADYLMDHSTMIYLMGPNGEPISFFGRDASPDKIAADLATYVS